jgi:hypothetical protein
MTAIEPVAVIVGHVVGMNEGRSMADAWTGEGCANST